MTYRSAGIAAYVLGGKKPFADALREFLEERREELVALGDQDQRQVEEFMAGYMEARHSDLLLTHSDYLDAERKLAQPWEALGARIFIEAEVTHPRDVERFRSAYFSEESIHGLRVTSVSLTPPDDVSAIIEDLEALIQKHRRTRM